ncbi:MAG: bifunctional histidinol-phosphatase/imidazoleglycerol-phosphate dehydratase HisB [Bacteroidales bacterium]|nr:bifunctional histidinol-phosphatase/imidazoleglycerol-phosphate dehydratase HisB [Bacteroidales bacterium]
MKKAIFIDRDGTIIREPQDEQIDSLEKLEFVPGAISSLAALSKLGMELVMVSNQDGLGTASFPESDFYPAHNKMLATLAGEGVTFDDILIDRSFPEDNSPCRKPGTGMLGKYMDGSYDLAGSYVIGDRESDAGLARNLGAKCFLISAENSAEDWHRAVAAIRLGERVAEIQRKTSETDIKLRLDLDGQGESSIDTGLKFFDHMLDQLVHHGGLSLTLSCKGDLEVDEHHSIEDIGIALGEALGKALGDKVGIERYGFALPMDESEALVLLDFGGRSELVWDVVFTREYVGDVPTEMFKHFFKSLSDAARCNLRIKASGENNHHIAEAVFKAFARCIRQAARRDPFSSELPSSKGKL